LAVVFQGKNHEKGTWMKRYASIALVLALPVLADGRPPSGGGDMLPPGQIDFRGAPISTVLEVYSLLVNKTLITDSRVEKIGTTITLKNEQGLPEGQAASLIEHALLEQAAVVITPLGERGVSVTYNDALPLVSNTRRDQALSGAAPLTQGPALVMQHFRVDTNSFFLNLSSRMKAERKQNDISLLEEYLKQQGIDVSPPFSTLYRPETGDLLIRPRKEDREKCERLMTELQSGK
jgi:type II secretory pathway component GspD/PulD (secretin)